MIDHYWVLDDMRVWSSATGGFVDEVPEHWLKSDPANSPSKVADETALTEALRPALPEQARLVGPTIADVRAEAARRMIVLLGADDEAHMDVLISNGTREAVQLLQIGQGNWTEEQATRAAQLEHMQAAIDEVREHSNILEAMTPVPLDYADDVHWPELGT